MKAGLLLRILASLVILVAGLPAFASACRMASMAATNVCRDKECCDQKGGPSCEGRSDAAHHAGCPAVPGGSASGSCGSGSSAASLPAILADHASHVAPLALATLSEGGPFRIALVAPPRLVVGIVGLDSGPPPRPTHRSDSGRSPPRAV